jgi:hypothetical protein
MSWPDPAAPVDRRRAWRRLRAWLAGAAALGAAAFGVLWWGQESLLFHPEPLPPDHRFGAAPDVHEVFIDVPGARLNALHLRLPRPRGLVFYLHGNAGNLDTWFVNPDFYRALNMDLFMVDYRGFGKSTGRIRGEAELLADARAAWQAVAPRYAGHPTVLLGRSLGTGVAAQLAAALPQAERPGVLLLVSPYLSLLELAAQHYPWVPARLLRYPMRTDLAFAALATAPTRVVLVHGEQDALIPPRHSEALAALLPRAELHRIAAAGHADLQAFPAYLDAIRQAIQQAVAAPQSTAH